MAEPVETPLTGGNMGSVTRLGDEVLRPAGEWTPLVDRLLRAYADAGIDETPRVLGLTADGRERLSYLPGVVPSDPMPAWVWSDAVLADAARLLRRLHDASVRLVGESTAWRSPVREPVEVVCHNDFAPYNMVFSDGRLSGVIDFDYASPGPRFWDLAYLAYRLVPLTGWRDPLEPGTDLARTERLSRLIEAYDVKCSAEELLAVVVARLDALADFSEAAAVRLGNPELADHATGYRADAKRIASGRLAP
ncbi:MAG TPA: phosphotransferase [Propionicimonas sp.]|nr:phosphotransferase [Propionicimonas sp.]HRA05727.1 phosphotransferase [Propionicimonas sp.]